MRDTVRFYTSNIPPVPIIAAVLHRANCPWALRKRLRPGDQAKMSDGWWERFESDPEALAAAEQHARSRPGSEITHRPSRCCGSG